LLFGTIALIAVVCIVLLIVRVAGRILKEELIAARD
jgi:hypothetical protein